MPHHAAPPFHRRAFVRAGAWLMAGLAFPAAAGPRPGALPLVMTVDDGPLLAPMPLLAPAERHAALRAALAATGAPAVLFITLGFGADRPEGLALARRFAEDGHRLANHTVTHLDLHDPQVTLARYAGEIDACDAVGRTLPNWRRWFRATYLNAGRDAAERDALQRVLAARGYRLAEVDLDSRDWQFSAPLQTRLLAEPDPQAAGVRELRTRFLGQLRERGAALAEQGRREPGRAQVLLVHDHLPMALWAADVVALMHELGFGFVEPERAWPAEG